MEEVEASRAAFLAFGSRNQGGCAVERILQPLHLQLEGNICVHLIQSLFQQLDVHRRHVRGGRKALNKWNGH